MRRVTALTLAASVFSLLMAPLASAQTDYPNRAITMVVPFAAGGATDVIGRIVAEGMSRHLGKPIIIELPKKISANDSPTIALMPQR